MKIVKRANPKSPHHKENNFYFSFNVPISDNGWIKITEVIISQYM